MALFAVSVNLRQTHRYTPTQREKPPVCLRLIKTKAQSRYSAMWKLFSIFVIWQMVTLPLWQPGHQHHHQPGQDFNNMYIYPRPPFSAFRPSAHACVSWGFVNNKFLCRKTRSCLWQSPIRCSILGPSRIIIISSSPTAGLCARRKKGYLIGLYIDISIWEPYFSMIYSW